MPGAQGERLRFSPTRGAAAEDGSRRHLSDAALLAHISAVYAEHRGACGRAISSIKVCDCRRNIVP